MESDETGCTSLLPLAADNGTVAPVSAGPATVWQRYPGMQALMYEFRPAVYYMRLLLPLVWILFGVPGNVLSFIVWTKSKLRSSSGYYLAAGALSDVMNQLLRMPHAVKRFSGVSVYDRPGVCQLGAVFFNMCQYNHTLLIGAFTFERYQVITHPFKRAHLCRRKRALKTIACLVTLSLVTSTIHGYFWYCQPPYGCTLRADVTKGGQSSLFSIWSWITELLFFGLLPVLVLILNMSVIGSIRRSRSVRMRYLQHYHGAQADAEPSSDEPSTTRAAVTALTLLTLSFYTIAMELPVTVLYCLSTAFPAGDVTASDEELASDAQWRRFLDYWTLRYSVENIAASHYAAAFYLSYVTSSAFRRETRRLCAARTCRRRAAVETSSQQKSQSRTQSLPLNTLARPDTTKV